MKNTGVRLIIVSFLIVLAVALLLSEEKEENKSMSEEEFINIYVKLSIAAEQYLAKPDSLKIVQDSIFTTSGYTSEDFNGFREKIDKNPEKWNNIWQKIVDRISEITDATPDNEEQEEVKKKKEK
ncbi:MAG: hypothetical protein ACLFSQ_04175 [Candidatus Zixiibacteriota bacterium]